MTLFNALLAAAVAATVCGCGTGSLLTREDRAHVCALRVDASPAGVAVQPNPFRNPGGGAEGAAVGALAGLLYLVSLPPMAPIAFGSAAVQGAACAAAAISYPDSEKDFIAIVASADNRRIARSLEAGFNAPRPGCPLAQARGEAETADAIVTITRINAEMGCLLDGQDYKVNVTWKMVDARTGRWLAETTTRCTATSALSAAQWAGDRERARAEVEQAFEGVGRRMALQLQGSEHEASSCSLDVGTPPRAEEQRTVPPPAP